MSARIFTADYDKEKVATHVWLPLGGAAVLGMAGLILALPILSIAGALLTFLALRFWPLTRTDRPALKLNGEGAEIDGLGFVRWGDIAGVEMGFVQVKSLKLPALDLAFRRPLPEAFRPSEATRLRPWEIRIFKLRRDGKMRLDLARLQDSPEDIHGAFRHFISGRD